MDYVLHQAALGSVPHSTNDPIATNRANVDGFLNTLGPVRDAGVRRFMYAVPNSSDGNHRELPKLEDRIGRPHSPYAVTKHLDEQPAGVLQRTYGLETSGIRYFNALGRRQDPNGTYAAVIPRWMSRLLATQRCEIYGNGETSRDFRYLDNALQANLLAAIAQDPAATDQVYKVACGDGTTLAAVRHDPRRAGDT